MDLSILTPIAAFGGFGLGIVNLGITVYKDFIRKAELIVEPILFRTRYASEGEYQFQLDIRLYAKKGLITIKDIKISNKETFTSIDYMESNEVPLRRAIRMNLFDLVKVKKSDFVSKITKIYELHSYPTTDLKIQSGEMKSISFIDGITTIRQSDGYDELPLYQWVLEVSYNTEESVKIPIKLEPIGEVRGVYSSRGGKSG